MTTLTGQTIRSYEVRERLGAGGFGEVYRAYQPLVQRDVAIKVILPDYANNVEFIRRFEREAQTVARLEHLYIVPLYDYWREPGSAYLVMRYLRGGNLRARMKRGALSLESAARMLDQIAAALNAAHRRDIIHRDLKPDNILLDEDGNAYLTDFGIAKDLRTGPDPAEQEAITGSPYYLSPEQIRLEPVTPQTDIYALGIVLYELLVGQHAFPESTLTEVIRRQLEMPLPYVQSHRPDLPFSINDIIQRATEKNPIKRYESALAMAAEFRRAVTGATAEARDARRSTRIVDIWAEDAPAHGRPTKAHDPLEMTIAMPTEGPKITQPLESALPEIENPYKGLRAFQEADAADFFGRAALVEHMLLRLRSKEGRFLAVVGPSGSGKSSLVKAGLIPALRRGAVPGSARWFVLEMSPGAHPMQELENALLRVAVTESADLHTALRADVRGLLNEVNRLLPDDESELLLVIDQFEELFTLSDDEPSRAHYLNSLLTACTAPESRLRLIVTLRADFYDRPLLYADFGALMRQHTEVVLPLSSEELEQAIIGPAQRAHLEIEPGLVEAIVNDVNSQPGALPLLQYALTELFVERTGNRLTLNAYRASGGVVGALARRAEAIYADLGESGQDAARQLFLRLVVLGEGTEDTRRRASQAEITSMPGREQIETVMAIYGKYRLLTFDRDPVTRVPTVEVAHEALLRTWERLRGWLISSREDVRIQRRLAGATAEWIGAGREASFLASGARLDQFEQWRANTDLSLSADENAYLQASIAAREEQQAREQARKAREQTLERRSRERLRVLVLVLAAAALGALGLSALAFSQRQLALDNEQAAINNNATAVSYGATSEANFRRSEGLRLVSEANAILQTANGSAELAALLSLRALQIAYSPQADLASYHAASRSYAARLFTDFELPVMSVAIAPDGKTLFFGLEDRTGVLQEVHAGLRADGQRLPLHGHEGAIVDAAFSPDGKALATASLDHSARLWEVATGRLIRIFTGHTDSLSAVAFSPDGRLLLTGSLDRSARLWEVATGAPVRQFADGTSPVTDVAFSPDGGLVLTGNGSGGAVLWETQTGERKLRFASEGSGHEYVTAVAFAPGDPALLATADFNGIISLWHTDGQKVRQFTGSPDPVNALAFSPDGRYILTASSDLTARLWETATGAEVRRLTGHDGWLTDGVFAPDGQTVLTASQDKTARLWDARTAAPMRQLVGHEGPVWAATFSPDGMQLVTAGEDTTARLWDAISGAELRRFEGHTDTITSAEFSPNGALLLTASYDLTARLWNVATGAEVRQFVGHENYVFDAAFAPDGSRIATASSDGSVIVWDTITGAEVQRLTGHGGAVFAVAFSPDGRLALTGAADQAAILWDIATGQEVRRLTGHSGAVLAVAFSPDGRLILTGSEDMTARLWEAATGAQVRQLVGHTGMIEAVALSRDGRLALTGGRDATARLWDVASGAEVRQIGGHTDQIHSVAFAPDTRFIVTGSWDGTARLWDTRVADWIAFVCARLPRDLSDKERARFGIIDDKQTCSGQ